MEQSNKCIFCDEELVNNSEEELLNCHYCNKKVLAKEKCTQCHYICESCKLKSTRDIIKDYCANTKSENPIDIMNLLMRHPAINIHGLEHHFLVSAALISAYYNTIGEFDKKVPALMEAEMRHSSAVKGQCGFYGVCGAAVGTGIYISIVTGANISSEEEWSLTNLMTANSLKSVAINGGPRCCKRHSYLVVEEAVKFTDKNLRVKMEMSDKITCQFSDFNAQCNKTKCIFYNAKNKEKIKV